MQKKILKLFQKTIETDGIETKRYSEKELSVVHEERTKQNKTLQKEYNKYEDYTSKLEFIYSLLFITQGEYLKYTNNEFLNDSHLNFLVQELAAKKNIDDKYFLEFINNKLIKPLNSGHLALKPVKIDLTMVDKDLAEKERKTDIKRDIESEDKNIVVKAIKDESDTLYIKIKSFSSSFLEQDKKVFKQIEEYLKNNQTKNIIFDIRGNKGGTDEYFKNFSIFTNKDIVIKDNFRNLLTNQNQEIIHTAIHGELDVKEYNRYILVDEEVFSTAETFSKLCKSTGFAKVVGQDTGGEGFGFTPFSLDIVDENISYIRIEENKQYNLNGARMFFQIEAPINEMGDIDYKNYYKTVPDIICNPNKDEDALERVLREIKERKDSKSKEDFER